MIELTPENAGKPREVFRSEFDPGKLGGYGLEAECHWKEYRPKVVARLRKSGELEEALIEAGRSAREYVQKAMSNGVPYEAAREAALMEFILLPDEDEPNSPEA